MRILRTSLLCLLTADVIAAAPAYVARVDLPVPAALHAIAVDLDGDGNQDVAAVSGTTNTLYVYYGRGDGTFRFPPDTYPTDVEPTFVAAGDLTADGVTSLPDLLVVSFRGTVPLKIAVSGDVSVFQNSGASPGAPSRFAVACPDLHLDGTGGANGNQPAYAVLQDFNKDNLLDIAASASFSSTIGTFFQTVMPPCATPKTCNFGWAKAPAPSFCAPISTGSNRPRAIAAGLFQPARTGGAETDLVSLNDSLTGASVIRYHVHAKATVDHFFTLTDPKHIYYVGNGATSGVDAKFLVADQFNPTTDSIPDLVAAAPGSAEVSLLVALNPTDFTQPLFEQPSRQFPANENPTYVATGDFQVGSATGALRDLVVANHSINRVSVLPGGNGVAGGFLKPLCYPSGQRPLTVTLARANSDAFDDLIVANDVGGSVSVLVGRDLPNGGFDVAYRRQTGGTPAGLAAGDFNGDGALDAVFVNEDTNTVGVVLGNDDGTFEEVARRVPVPGTALAIAAGSFNGDLSSDAAVLTDMPSEIHVLIAVGDGTLRDDSTLPAPPGSIAITTAAFDADTATDIAVLVGSPGGVSLLRGDPTGKFRPLSAVSLGATLISMTVGSFDAIPGADVVVVDSASLVTLLRNDGAGGLVAGATVNTGAVNPTAITSGDVNGDTFLDLVVTHDDGSVVVLLGDGTGTFVAMSTVRVPGVATAPLIGELTGGAGNDVMVLLPDSDTALVIPWENAGQLLNLSTAVSYGVGNKPRAAVARAFDPASSPLDTVLVADGSDAPDTWGVTVLGSRRSGRALEAYPPADAGPDLSACPIPPAGLIIGTPPKSYLTYSWAPPSGLSNANVAQPSAQPGTYTVTVTNPETGLARTDSVTVSAGTVPVVSITPAVASYCFGSAPLVLDAGGGYASYAWFENGTPLTARSQTLEVSPVAATTYRVDVTTSAGCSGTATRRVDVAAGATANAVISPELRCAGAPARFTAAATVVPPPTTYLWALPGSPVGWSLSAPNTATTDVLSTSNGKVVVELTMTTGTCVSKRSFWVEVIPATATVDAGNLVRGIRNVTQATFSWAPSGSPMYDLHFVANKAAIPNIFQLTNRVQSVPTTTATDSTVGFFQVQGKCP